MTAKKKKTATKVAEVVAAPPVVQSIIDLSTFTNIPALQKYVATLSREVRADHQKEIDAALKVLVDKILRPA